MNRIMLLVAFTFCLGCNQRERNCAEFKTGTFKFTYVLDGIEKTSQFKRTDDLNIDYLETGNDTASIRWINECEFIQKSIDPKTRLEEQAVHFKILSTTDSTYTFEYSLAIKPTNKAHRVERGTAIKIK